MRAAVLGSPIAHSLSPRLHRAAYAALGLPWTYEAIEVDEAALPGFVAALDGTWAGLSLTMPLKEAVLPLLDEVGDDAMRVRAVNTVVPCATGWRGENTDIHGIVAALEEAGAHGAVRATVLGSGATARSAIAALARLGVADVDVCARRPESVAGLVELAGAFGLRGRGHGFEASAALLGAGIVISTVPAGVAEAWARAAEQAGTSASTLLDVAYQGSSALVEAWLGPIATGRSMLLWQAVEQVRLMTGEPGPVAAMRAALDTPPDRA